MIFAFVKPPLVFTSFAISDRALETNLPLWPLMIFAFVKPPPVFTFFPAKTSYLRYLPRAILVAFIDFIDFMDFIDFKTFVDAAGLFIAAVFREALPFITVVTGTFITFITFGMGTFITFIAFLSGALPAARLSSAASPAERRIVRTFFVLVFCCVILVRSTVYEKYPEDITRLAVRFPCASATCCE